MKLIKSVPLSLILILSLSGCASLGSLNPFGSSKDVKPIEVRTKAEERTKLNLTAPEPLNLKSPRWIIITKENNEQVWKDLDDDQVDPVLFGLTDQGYETLSIMIAELRNYINTQRLLIEQYKKYYEQQDKKEATTTNK